MVRNSTVFLPTSSVKEILKEKQAWHNHNSASLPLDDTTFIDTQKG
jgi:hypothetical protein